MDDECSDIELIAKADEIEQPIYHIHTLPPKDERKWKDYILYPYLAMRSYFVRILRVLGWRFLVFICTSQLLLKGITYYVVSSIMLPLFKQVLNVSASRLQFMLLVVLIPWSIKPLIGLMSDLTLIGGYHKRYWLLLSLAIGMLCSGLAFVAYANLSAIGISLCLMGIQFEIALFDLMSESSYSAVMRDNPQTGSDIVTLVQGCQHAGAMTAMLFVGIMSDHHLFNALFTISLVLCLVPLGPTLLGWLPEEQYPGGMRVYEPPASGGRFISACHRRCAAAIQWIDYSQIKRDKGMIAVIAFTGISAPITALVANASDPAIALAVSVLLTIASLMGAFLVFPRMVFKIALYQVLTSLSRPALGSAMDYFYTGDARCVPGGPQFSMAFYLSTAGLIGSVMTFVGVWIYQAGLSNLKFRTVLIVTNLLSGAIGASDLFIVLRFNIAMGIPDKVAFLMGESVGEPLLNMLNYIPSMALLSKVMPIGMESSCFALLAGLGNFASMISELSGALIFEAAGVKTMFPCNFDNLWWLIIVCHVTGPIVVGTLAAFLIPNVKQTDELK